LFKGEVTSIEPEFADAGYVLYVVRGYAKSHRLHRGKKTRVFANQTDSAIVQKVAQEAGLSASVDATSATRVHMWQVNQTDMEFIRWLAELNGYKFHMQDGTLNFKKFSTVSGSPVDLEWKESLISFRPRVAATHQADKVAAQGWDPMQKQLVKGEASSATSTSYQGGVSGDGGAAAKKAFSTAQDRIVDVGLVDQGHATKVAQARYDEIEGGFVQAEGVCIGHPQVKAGQAVNIKGVGTKFSGKYVVTSATHIYTTDHGYETQFSIHGQQPDTVADLVGAGGRDGRGLMLGVVPALVTNVKDEDKHLPRVKVKFAWLDDQLESGWARVAAPGAGAKRGIYYSPEVDDEVLIAFEHGDINRPYVLGGLWNGKDAAPLQSDQNLDNGKVTQRIIQSRSGHVIILDDKQDAEQIIIRDKSGKNQIVIESKSGSEKITIKCGKDIAIQAAGQGAISIKSDSGDLTLEGKSLTIKTQQNFSVQATGACNIKSTQACTVEGTAGLTLKNAAAQIAMSGPTVNINNGALEVM
jgi:phage protein D